MNAVSVDASEQPLAAFKLTRGARHLAFLAKGRTLVFLRGDIQHKNVWTRELSTGAERQLTNVAPDFNIRDFDISPDGREVILERAQERSDVVLLISPIATVQPPRIIWRPGCLGGRHTQNLSHLDGLQANRRIGSSEATDNA